MASSESAQSDVIADVENVEDQLKSVSITESTKTGKDIQDVAGKSQPNASVKSGKDISDDLVSDEVGDGSTSNSETTSLHGCTTLMHGTEENNLDLHAKGDNSIVSSCDTNTAGVECQSNNNCDTDGSQPYTVSEENVDDPSTILGASEETREGVEVEEGSCQQTEDSVTAKVKDEEKSDHNSDEDEVVTDDVTADQITQSDDVAADTSAQLDLQSSEEKCTVTCSVSTVDISSSTSSLPADVGHGPKPKESFVTESVGATDPSLPGSESACDEDEVRSRTRDAEGSESKVDAEGTEFKVDAEGSEFKVDAEGTEFKVDAEGSESKVDAEGSEFKVDAEGSEFKVDAEGTEFKVDAEGSESKVDAEGTEFKVDAEGTEFKVDAEGTESKVDAEGTESKVDAEGTESKVDAEGTESKVDAEGTESKVDAEGSESKVDAEGTESKVDAEGTESKVDAEGSEYKGDVEGTESKVDAEGTESKVDAEGSESKVDAEGTESKVDAEGTESKVDAEGSEYKGDVEGSEYKGDARCSESKGDISAMIGKEMKPEPENQSISDIHALKESHLPVSVPETREVSASCDTKIDGTRILADGDDSAKEHLKDNTTELKQTKSINNDQINRIGDAEAIPNKILEEPTPEMTSEGGHDACGEDELVEDSAGADSGDTRDKSVSDVRPVSPGKSVRKRFGRKSKNPPGMGYSSLLRRTAEKDVDWEIGGEGEEHVGDGEEQGGEEQEQGGEEQEQGGEEDPARTTRSGKKNRRKKKKQNKDFPVVDAADEERVEQLQDFDDGSVDEDPGDIQRQSGRAKRDRKQLNRLDRQERRREEDMFVEEAIAYFGTEWGGANNSRSVYYDISGMAGQFMDDVDDDDDDDEGNRIRNKRRNRGRGRGQIYDEGGRRGGRGRGRGRARGSREFRRTRTDRSDSSSHSGKKPEEYSSQDVRRSHSSVSESSSQSALVHEDRGSFENVQDRGYLNLTITASGDGTRHVETDCYSSFVNSVGSGGRRRDNKKKMNKKGGYANQTRDNERDNERFQEEGDMHAQYQDRRYTEGQVMDGSLEEVPLKKKDKRKKKKRKEGGERESDFTYANESSHFVEGDFQDQNQYYDQDAASHDSQEPKMSRKQKNKQRHQRQSEGRSEVSEDYGYSGSFKDYEDRTYSDHHERPLNNPEGQIAAQQLPQKQKRSHIEEGDTGLSDLDRGVAPSPRGRPHRGAANTRGSSRARGGDSRRGRRGSRNNSGSYEHRHYSGDGHSQGRNDRFEPSHRSMSPRSNQGHHGDGNEFPGQNFRDYHSQPNQGHSRRGHPGRRNHPNSHASAMTGHPQSPRMGQNVQQLENESRSNRNRSHLGQGQSRPGSSVEGQQTSEGRQGQGQKEKRRWTKKPKQAKFEPHLSKEEVADGLKRGTLIEGPIRINQKNYSEAYVPLPDGTADIYISGLNHRNRALNGDIVAVQLQDKQEWKVYVDGLQSIEAKVKPSQGQGEGDVAGGDGNDSGPDVVVEEVVQTTTEAKDSGSHKKKDATPRKTYTSLREVMAQGSPVAKALMDGAGDQGEAVDRNKLLQKTGKVVAVLEAKHSRVCSGHIKLMQDRNKEVALFSPSDSRVPRIQVPMSDCPKDFFERPDDHAKMLFIARITEWDNSMFAKGHLSRSLGEAGQIEPETEAILLEHNVESDDFPEQVLSCLPASPWVIPESEFEYREDLRKQCIFTIDPSTARDLDDAVSIEELGNGYLKVGVHIADVSFFLEEGTPLDMKAASRATSVYLVQKVVPMLPRLLCEELCSLNPDQDRLTFSVIWTMDANGEIEDEWFGRTVIRSCVKLSYDHAQGFIENPDREWSQEELPPISKGFVVEDIRKRVLQLDKIAKCLRKKRFDSGALRLDQVKLTFALDKDTGMPNGYSVYEQKDSNRLIEEFMLLANMAVAHKIYKSYPQKAVLRRHPPPQSKMVDDLKDLCEQLGLAVDLSNSQTWQQSLSNYQGTDEFSAARMQVLVALSSKPMQNAKYFCSGMIADPEVYRHYALNVPLYTHFTSPIRRYPDVLVHRLLASSLKYCPETGKDHQLLHKQADHCNDKKYMAKRVQEMSSEMFFAAFVKEVGPFEEKAMVMGVMDHSVDVFILKFGVSKRIYCDQLPLQGKTYIRDHKQPILTLVWDSDDNQPEAIKQTLKIFTSVTICMMGDRDPLKWKAVLKRPTEK